MIKLSVKEQHIYVTQSLQRQGAYRKDKQYPQAIDLALTRAQERIIKARLVPSQRGGDTFEINTKFASDIQTLVKTNILLPTFYQDTTRSYGVLPYDFSYLLSDKSYVTEDCKASFKSPTETKTERVISIPFVNGASAPYFRNIVLGVGVQTVSLVFPGFQTTDERTYLVDYIIDGYKSLGVTVYWEDYKDIHRDKCFLVVTNTLNLSCNLIVDGTSASPNNIDTTPTYFKSALTEGYLSLNRDVKADFLDSALTSVYHASIPTSPVATLENNQIVVNSSERFLVNKIYANYIRKPKRISLSLNQGSELHPTVHTEMCDVAVEILKAQIEDPGYEVNRQDVQERILNN